MDRVGAWLTAMVATVAIGWWIRRGAVIALGAVGGSALLGAAGMAAMIPPTRQFGIVPYNYYWMWPIGIFATTAAVAAGLAATRHSVRVMPDTARRRLLVVAAAACVALAGVAGRPVNGLPETADEPTAGDRVGRELLGELGASLDRLDIEGPVVIDLAGESFANHFPYTMLVELQRRDIPFTFPPRDINRARFGSDRCEDGTSPHRLVLADGAASLTPRQGELVLAQVDAVTATEKSEHAALSSEFADLLRDGTVPLSFGALSYFAIEPDPRLTQVFQDPDVSAAGLAAHLRSLRPFSIVKIPDVLATKFARWLQLENLLTYDRVAIFLAPNQAQYDDCDSVGPDDTIITD